MRLAMIVALVLAGVSHSSGQSSAERDRARPHVRLAWESMRTEAWAEAAKSFERAIEIDKNFEDAYYGLGLANVRMRKYGEAIAAYLTCRDLYRAQTGKRFASQQEAQRYRQDRITEIDELIRQYSQGAQTAATQDRLRQLQQQRRDIQDRVTRGNNMSVDEAVPSYVYLGLGSAYFRTEQWAEAEREYKAAIVADPKSGEAYNNLAVVYLQTGRVKEADEALQAAERAGYKVHPQLKADVKAKRG